MKITDFNAIPQAPADDDVMAIEVGGVTYKVSKSVLASAILAQIGGDPVTVAHGGTGLTASPSMQTNLASTSAANVMQASPRPGVTGTLPVANGGTGLTASPSMLTNLGSTSAANVMQASPRPGVTGTLPVANGGTGATTTAAAKAALGIVNNATIDFQVMKPSATTQMLSLVGTVANSNNQYYGHRVGLGISNTSLFLWDFTDQRTIWTITAG